MVKYKKMQYSVPMVLVKNMYRIRALMFIRNIFIRNIRLNFCKC